jgi:probable F420-dependent oxidoreductase
LKFGLRYCNTGRYVDPVHAVELLQAAEEAGFESAWTVEHTVVPAGYASAYPYSPDGKMPGAIEDFPLPDPLIWMAYVAAATTTIKLATGILILPQHNPVVVAKQVATLDYLSRGRVLLGIGVGWLKEEFDAIGASFADRGERTDEYVHALRALWSEAKPSFHGKTVHFHNAYCRPQPVRGTVPIIVGGHSPAAARRAGRIGDGFFPARGASAELITLARRTAEQHDRDPARLEITTSMPATRAGIADLAKLGVSRVLIPVGGVGGAAGSLANIANPEDALEWRGVMEQYAD